jgi:hypothetical protein
MMLPWHSIQPRADSPVRLLHTINHPIYETSFQNHSCYVACVKQCYPCIRKEIFDLAGAVEVEHPQGVALILKDRFDLIRE